MRVILVGSPSHRARVRDELRARSIEVIGEFSTLDAAQASTIAEDADAIVMVRLKPDPTDRAATYVGAGFSRTSDPSNTADIAQPLLEPLTPREVQVIELMAEGLSNKAIASRLGISDQTVKFHVAAIAGKLGARNRTDAVRLAVRKGLVTL